MKKQKLENAVAPECTFKVGDVVHLKSAPTHWMTVTNVGVYGDDISVIWIDVRSEDHTLTADPACFTLVSA